MAKVSIAQAEQAVVLAAMGCVNGDGWIFQERGMNGAGNATYVLKPDAVRRLENAIAKLKEARKAKRKSRPDRSANNP